MGRFADMQKKKMGGAAGDGAGKPAIRQEPLGEARAEGTVPARPQAAAQAAQSSSAPLQEVSPSMFIDAPQTPAQAEPPQAPAPSAQAPSPAPASVSASVPPSTPQNQPPVIDEQVLKLLPQEAFINFCCNRLNSLGLSSQQEMLLASLENPEVATMLRVAKERNAISVLLMRQAPASAQSYGDSGNERSQRVSVYDATMASDMNMVPSSQQPLPPVPQAASQGPQQMAPPSSPPTAAVGRRPPPPPPHRKKPSEPPPVLEATRDLPVSELGEFMNELRESGDSTKDRHERAVAFFNSQRDGAIAKYGKDALAQAQKSAKQKQQAQPGETVDYTPEEQFMLELGDLNKFIGWLKKRMDDERGVHEAMKANGKNGGEKPAAPSMPPPAPSPASVSAPPTALKSPYRDAPQEAENPAAPSQRPSAPPSAKPRAGALSRFFSNYTTWSVFGIASFSGALAYTNQFRDLAIGAKNIYQYVSGRQIGDIPTMWAVGVYSAVMASAVIIGTLVTRAKARRVAERSRARSLRSDADKEKEKYALRKLAQITLNCVKEKEQLSQLRQELRSDELFFAAMYYLRKDSVFDDILDDANISEKLRGTIRSSLLPQTEQEIMQRKLNRFTEIIYSPRDRANLFRKLYEEDVAFQLICDELFLRNLSGDPVNSVRAKDVFAYVANSTGENVGPPLMKALQQDYDDIISTRK